MSSAKLLVVFGATGNQGGSVASTFIEEPGWQVRALTRNPSSPKAQALAARGAEVVHADLDNPGTFSAAFEGAHAIFLVSDYWGQYADPVNQGRAKPGQPLTAWVAEHETQQLKDAIDAVAKVPTLERFILSSLSNATKWSNGKYPHVYYFDSKANAEIYGRNEYPELWAKTSVFQAGLFLSNHVGSPIGKPTKNKEGTVQFFGTLEPEVKVPYIAAEEDTGPIVKALINEPAGKNVIGYRAWLTVQELAQTFTNATGLKAESVTLSNEEAFQYFPDELKVSAGEGFSYYNEFGYEGRDDPTIVHPRDLETTLSLGTVEEYWKKQDWSKVLGV
ncbi:hypothetical protein ACHAQA_002479 [Verticillium albo-atrum]